MTLLFWSWCVLIWVWFWTEFVFIFFCRRYSFTTLEKGLIWCSILRSIAFINNILDNVRFDKICCYADDTGLLNRERDGECLKKKSNLAESKANKWFCANDPLMNIGKTQKLVFNNSVHNHAITHLGLQYESSLSWKMHINNLSKQLSTSVIMKGRIPNWRSSPLFIAQHYMTSSCGTKAAKPLGFFDSRRELSGSCSVWFAGRTAGRYLRKGDY